MKILWKILRSNVSITQFSGFFIANLIGLTIVLAGLRFKEDLTPIFNQGDSFLKDDYMVVSKRVTALNTLAISNSGFSTAELEDLEQQPFVNQVGKFEAARYRVSGGLKMDGTDLYFQTYMFFESVPDNFIDIPLDDWNYDSQTNEIPIIIPRAYLNLYNFGFAESRSMPKLSEGMIKLLRLDIYISGNGKKKEYKGKIVGFSNRLNTILVPQSFMTQTNTIYGSNKTEEPVRLILEVNNASDERITRYLETKKYETDGEKTNDGKLSYFMRIVINIVLAVGILICILSFFILVLSIYLLLQKNAEKLRTLRLIGYSDLNVCTFYMLVAISLNLIASILSISFVVWLRQIYLPVFTEIMPKTDFPGVYMTIVYALMMFLVVSIIDIAIIYRKISKLI